MIKVEQPEVGDPMRVWGREKPHGQSLWWPVVARNKKSVTLNLRVPEGQEILKKLVAEADVLLENFRPGTLERWNLGYDELSKINPRLIMVRVSGYGQSGPYAHKAGYASVGEAMAGMRYLMGYPDRAPSRAGISIGDTLAATYAALGCMMAIEARHKTGRGQIVDSAIYEACMAMMESTFTEYAATGYVRERSGSTLPNVSPSNIYPAANGAMVLIAANQDTVFRRLANAMKKNELAEDPRYCTHDVRGANQEELDVLIGEWTKTWDAAELLDHLESNGVPCGKVYDAADVVADEHVKARESLINVPHREFGKLVMQNAFPRLSETPGSVEHAGPELGEHNEDILSERLGYSAAELQDLKSRSVI